MRDKLWVGALWVSDDVPRYWTGDEISLLETVAERVWQAIEKIQSERTLRLSEARLRTMAASVPSIIWEATPDGTITFHNEQWLHYTGLTPEQNAQNWPQLVLHPDDFERCITAWTRALATGADYHIEVRNRRHDGAYRWFLTRAVPVRNDKGEIISWAGSTTDIHDNKLLEQALRESEERLQLALDAAEMGTFLYHPQDDRGELDARMLTLFGLREGDTLNLAEALARMIHPDDREYYAAEVGKAVDPNGDGKLNADIRLIHPDGSLHWVTVTVQTVFEGEPPHAVWMSGVAIDISERKRLEQRKDEFVALASHEMRTPLTAIKGYSQILLQTLSKSQATQGLPSGQGSRQHPGSHQPLVIDNRILQMLRTIDSKVNYLSQLVSDMLDVTGMEQGELPLQREPFDLALLVDEVVSTLSLTVPDFDITFDRAAVPVLVHADRQRIEQVVINLINNAVKYSGDSRKLRVKVETERGEAITSVRDYGVGIPADEQSQVFERFFRGTNANMAYISGLGLGLYISHGIVARHEGRMWLESMPGEGSTFYFAIPLSDA
jgi:PAS domain S-box-containing protein